MDADFDGFCADDPLECDDTNPNVPGFIGQICSDGDPLTLNDVFVSDSLGSPVLSCTCEGTPWENPTNNSMVDECNIIVGAPLDFEQDNVGYTYGTYYNGLAPRWRGQNSVDIGHN